MKKVLLIEDDQVMRENTSEILELANFKMRTASNGKEGIHQVKIFQPDLIICDIMMPDLDGYGVLHMLSRDPSTSTIPFIFLSAKTEKSEIRKGMELGADDYLTKPYDETDLLNAIEMRLKKAELFKNIFSKDINGLNDFLDNARGLKSLETLSKEKKIVRYKKRQVVFHEGDIPQYLYFISKGKVKTYRTHDEGKEYITDVLNEGDFFGLNPLFENKVYSDSAIVLEDSEISKIAKDDFLSLVYKNRDVAAQFIKMLSNNVDQSERQMLSLAYDSVRKRTAEALVNLEARYSVEGVTNTEISVSREDLAGMAGTATETVIRCLGDLKEDNLICVRGRKIIVTNLKGLKEVQY